MGAAYWLPVVTQVLSLGELHNVMLSRLVLISAAGADTAGNTTDSFSF